MSCYTTQKIHVTKKHLNMTLILFKYIYLLLTSLKYPWLWRIINHHNLSRNSTWKRQSPLRMRASDEEEDKLRSYDDDERRRGRWLSMVMTWYSDNGRRRRWKKLGREYRVLHIVPEITTKCGLKMRQWIKMTSWSLNEIEPHQTSIWR